MTLLYLHNLIDNTDVQTGPSRAWIATGTSTVVVILILILANIIAVVVSMIVYKHKRKGECTFNDHMYNTIIMILENVVIAKRSDSQTDQPSPENSGTITHTDDPQETIHAHICFDLEDKPMQLLNALNSLMVSFASTQSQAQP